MKSHQIDEYIKKNWDSKTVTDIATAVSLNVSSVRRRARKLGIKPKSSGFQPKVVSVEDMRKEKEYKTSESQWKKNAESLLKENEKLNKMLSIKNELEPYKRVQIVSSKTSGQNEATAVVLASDWHLEQRVSKDKLLPDCPNEYNLEIAEKRAKQFFDATLILIKEAEQNVKVKNLVLWLGGDFITGNIHTENLKICQLGPAQAVCFARDILISGIEFLLEKTDIDITIPFNHGNHARITDKVWKSSEEDNSLEHILYDDIAFHFKNERRIRMVAPSGSATTLEIYGMKIAFVHGHHGFRYQDGVGGLYIPARKYVMRKFPKYDLVCMGHHHQYVQDKYFICNGSMIGYDQYADSCGFPYEKPKQTFFLIEEKRRERTVTRPILFND